MKSRFLVWFKNDSALIALTLLVALSMVGDIVHRRFTDAMEKTIKRQQEIIERQNSAVETAGGLLAVAAKQLEEKNAVIQRYREFFAKYKLDVLVASTNGPGI